MTQQEKVERLELILISFARAQETEFTKEINEMGGTSLWVEVYIDPQEKVERERLEPILISFAQAQRMRFTKHIGVMGVTHFKVWVFILPDME